MSALIIEYGHNYSTALHTFLLATGGGVEGAVKMVCRG